MEVHQLEPLRTYHKMSDKNTYNRPAHSTHNELA